MKKIIIEMSVEEYQAERDYQRDLAEQVAFLKEKLKNRETCGKSLMNYMDKAEKFESALKTILELAENMTVENMADYVEEIMDECSILTVKEWKCKNEGN